MNPQDNYQISYQLKYGTKAEGRVVPVSALEDYRGSRIGLYSS